MRYLIYPLGLSAVLLGGCAEPQPPETRAEVIAEVKQSLDTLDTATALPVPETRAKLARQPEVQPIIGRGYAQTAQQPGKSLNQRRLLAMRAARVEALRDIAEQVHGVKLDGATTIADARLQNDRLNALVDGTVRGAETVEIRPKGGDGYEVEMVLDADMIALMLRIAKGD